jgi:hypothetical protein
MYVYLFGSAERGRRRSPSREHRANPVLATSLETCLLAAFAHLISLSKLGFLKVENRGGGGGGGGGGGDCFALRLDTRYDRGDGLSVQRILGFRNL